MKVDCSIGSWRDIRRGTGPATYSLTPQVTLRVRLPHAEIRNGGERVKNAPMKPNPDSCRMSPPFHSDT
ncbi:hypothetical protein AOLI_G00262280 [Acnodon oligacanthus]